MTGYVVPIKVSLYHCWSYYYFLSLRSNSRSIFTYFSGAFNGTAAAGGFIGSTVASAIQIGMARGVFANEAGLGVHLLPRRLQN